MSEEGAPDVGFHAPAEAVEELAHPVPCDAGHERDGGKHRSVSQDKFGTEFLFQRVDGHLEYVGGRDREQIAQDDEHEPDRDSQAVRAEVG